jgi:cytochrome c oxidase cbb3-type subunit I/II
MYIWAGPHHLLYTSMPEWAQTLGMIFSVALWAPSWGGMINGLLTLRGAWHLLRTEPIIKFFVAAVTFYAMSTFEGPLLSIKSVNGLAHYTDWIIGHVHAGALGWNGFMAFGMLYFLVPKLWNTKLYSTRLANMHFWYGTLGILVYYISMWAAGITQGLMWRAVDAKGSLVYPDFVETVTRIVPLYWVRVFGGLLFIVGFLIMLYNLIKTMQSGKVTEDTAVAAPAMSKPSNHGEETAHRKLEGLATVFGVLVFFGILVGSVIEIYPMLSLNKFIDPVKKINPYTPLELAGRDVYIKEGCYVCHSQQIRPMASEVLRYGPASTIEESMYDHPFQWGSKRTGPDLSREGKVRNDVWHYRHMMDPRSMTAQSIMPSYEWLAKRDTEFLALRKKVSVMKMLNVPYDQETLANADMMAEKEAVEIANRLRAEDPSVPAGIERKEIIALIAYLQALGQKGIK